MKLLHTADLHIGAGRDQSRSEKEVKLLTNIVKIAHDEESDAVLLTGDILESAELSVQQRTLLEDFMAELIKQKTALLLISGERDAGAFAAFADKFTEKQGVYIAEEYKGSLKRVFLKDEWGPVDFVCMPFVKNAPVSMEQRLAATPMPLDFMSRHVLLTHCVVTEENGRLPELTEGESMEGLDEMSASWLGAFDYVALGHTNKRQRMGSREVWYPGAPLFGMEAESDKKESVNLVRLGRKGDISVEAAEI
ncbi:MAG: metallophosphoesterase family protein [Lachnospiraceae bacterium]|nr:metallophosphoesterase family protein [Lachnospiraceae bacterium]